MPSKGGSLQWEMDVGRFRLPASGGIDGLSAAKVLGTPIRENMAIHCTAETGRTKHSIHRLYEVERVATTTPRALQ